MKKRINLFYLAAPLFLLLLTACEKEGELIVSPIKEFKPYTMDGFAVGGPLEQYFDGVKVRELYGRATLPNGTNKIGFEKEEIMMELRSKSTGKTVYQQKFSISNDTSKVPKFYFDGTKMHDTYTYPTPQGKEYLANFYFDFPKDSGAVDIVIEMIEYYLDWNLDDPMVAIDTTAIPVATNIQPGKWTDYIELKEMPVLPKHHPDAEFYPYICVKKAGKSTYVTSDKLEENSFKLEFPAARTTEGKVQSIFIGWTKKGPAISLQPQQNLVDLFGR